MSRKLAGKKTDENIHEKVRKMKERQKQWMEERESSRHSEAASKSASSVVRKKYGETTGSKSSSLAWISKDDYQSSSRKRGAKISNRGASREFTSRELDYASPTQVISKHNLDSNRFREPRKSETSIAGYDDGQHRSTRAPNSPIYQHSLLNNNQTGNGAAESFNDLADKIVDRLQVSEEKRRETNKLVDLSRKHDKPMLTHVCSSCKNLMAAPHSPVAIIPCGHTFCQICVGEYSKCPQCQSEVFSTAPNTVMQQIIEDFRKKQEKERLQLLEEQTRKYVVEYQNLNLRCEGLAGIIVVDLYAYF